jgi:sugar phosphate permease
MRGGSSSSNNRLEHQKSGGIVLNKKDDDTSDEEEVKKEVFVSPDSRRKMLFLVTYFAYIAIYFARKPLSVLKPVLEKELGISRVAMGNMDTTLLACYAAGQLMLGQV